MKAGPAERVLAIHWLYRPQKRPRKSPPQSDAPKEKVIAERVSMRVWGVETNNQVQREKEIW
jgi:hypothetical protein